jgi:hypothetical protein
LTWKEIFCTSRRSDFKSRRAGRKYYTTGLSVSKAAYYYKCLKLDEFTSHFPERKKRDNNKITDLFRVYGIEISFPSPTEISRRSDEEHFGVL